MPIKSQVDRNWPSMYCWTYHEFIRQLKKFPKIYIWTAISLAGNYESYLYASWKKLIHLVLLQFKPFKPSIWYIYTILFSKIKIFKELNMPGISGFSFWAIEPKDEKGGKFRKPHFSGKWISETISWVRNDLAVPKLPNFVSG